MIIIIIITIIITITIITLKTIMKFHKMMITFTGIVIYRGKRTKTSYANNILYIQIKNKSTIIKN